MNGEGSRGRDNQDFACSNAVNQVSHLFLERGYSRQYCEDWAKLGEMAKPNLKSNNAYFHKERIADAMRDLNKSGLPTGIRLIFTSFGELREARRR